jgi:hypothetical protein
MFKKILLMILLFTVSQTIIFGYGAFIAMSLNPREWTEFGRVCFVFCAIFVGSGCAIIPAMLMEDK